MKRLRCTTLQRCWINKSSNENSPTKRPRSGVLFSPSINASHAGVNHTPACLLISSTGTSWETLSMQTVLFLRGGTCISRRYAHWTGSQWLLHQTRDNPGNVSLYTSLAREEMVPLHQIEADCRPPQDAKLAHGPTWWCPGGNSLRSDHPPEHIHIRNTACTTATCV